MLAMLCFGGTLAGRLGGPPCTAMEPPGLYALHCYACYAVLWGILGRGSGGTARAGLHLCSALGKPWPGVRGNRPEISGPVFLCFRPKPTPRDPLDRRDPPCTSISTKYQPRRPILRPLRSIKQIPPGCFQAPTFVALRIRRRRVLRLPFSDVVAGRFAGLSELLNRWMSFLVFCDSFFPAV